MKKIFAILATINAVWAFSMPTGPQVLEHLNRVATFVTAGQGYTLPPEFVASGPIRELKLKDGVNPLSALQNLMQAPSGSLCIDRKAAIFLAHWAEILRTAAEISGGTRIINFSLGDVPSFESILPSHCVRPGDAVYIPGHPAYIFMHFTGADRGQNVLCVGKNAGGEDLFLGFGAGLESPKTLAEIQEQLAAAYALPTSERDQKIMTYMAETYMAELGEKVLDTTLIQGAKGQTKPVRGIYNPLAVAQSLIPDMIAATQASKDYAGQDPREVVRSQPLRVHRIDRLVIERMVLSRAEVRLRAVLDKAGLSITLD
jgi:hypothetical protein